MKKLLLIMTLVLPSFFFVFISNVRAESIIYEVQESDFELLNEKFFALREATINYCNKNNKKYIIACDNNNCYANIFDEGLAGFTYNWYGSLKIPQLWFDSVSVYTLSNNELKFSSSTTSRYNFYIQATGAFTLRNFIDNNLDLTLPFDSSLTYNGSTYDVPTGSPFPTLYTLNEILNKPEEPVDKFLEEKEIMNNFYSTIFIKIGELATNLANNYIFLLIFGIFILIFIFEIIRRRLL